MPFNDTLSVATAPEDPSSTAKNEIFVNFQEFFLPEIFFVEYVGTEYLGCDPASQILKTFSREPSFNCSVVL